MRKLIFYNWLKVFFYAALSFLLLLTIATLVSGFTRDSVTSSQVLINYLFELPKWFKNLLPFACLMATLFSLNFLKARNELIAIFSLGMSHRAFIQVVVQAATIVMAVQLLVSAYILPSVTKKRYEWLIETGANFKSNLPASFNLSKKTGKKIWYKMENGFFNFVALDQVANELKEVEIFFISKNHLVERFVKAKSAIFKKDNLWEFHDVLFLYNLEGEEFPIIEMKNISSYALLENPENIRKVFSEVETLPIEGLYSYIKNIKRTGINTSEFEVLLLEKINSALICIVFALIPIFSIYSPSRRHSSFGKIVFFTLVFGVVYWLISSSMLALGKNGSLPPVIAVFSVPFIFILLISSIIYKNRKLG
ncbi:MAG: LptF/LptG family permease [Bacteriovoracaceae bacterium]|nr:LptF/LptG family permease [Bacteriovoracaceae bacterium]